MRKSILVLVALLAFQVSSIAAVYKEVDIKEFPKKSQEFLTTYFPKQSISFSGYETDPLYEEYRVILGDNSRVYFDTKGEWIKVDCIDKPLPQGIVPTVLVNFVNKVHPDLKIFRITRDRTGYQVKLMADVKLKFDTKGRFVCYEE